MANKRHKPEEIVRKLGQVDVLVRQGMVRVDAIREVHITETTSYRRCTHYGRMGTDQLKELKRRQKEKNRLKKAVSDLTLDKHILKEAAGEIFEPRALPSLDGADPQRNEGIGASDLPRACATSLDTMSSTKRPGRQGAAGHRHSRVDLAIRQLRL